MPGPLQSPINVLLKTDAVEGRSDSFVEFKDDAGNIRLIAGTPGYNSAGTGANAGYAPQIMGGGQLIAPSGNFQIFMPTGSFHALLSISVSRASNGNISTRQLYMISNPGNGVTNYQQIGSDVNGSGGIESISINTIAGDRHVQINNPDATFGMDLSYWYIAMSNQ